MCQGLFCVLLLLIMVICKVRSGKDGSPCADDGCNWTVAKAIRKTAQTGVASLYTGVVPTSACPVTSTRSRSTTFHYTACHALPCFNNHSTKLPFKN